MLPSLEMGYVDENLITGEVVTYRARLHWISLTTASVIGVVIGGVGLVLLANTMASESANRTVLLLLALVLLAAGGAPVIAAVLRNRASEFAVTNKRVIFKTGIVHRNTTEMFLIRSKAWV
jgi:hypothetical protein